MARVKQAVGSYPTKPNNTTRIKPGQARRKKPGSGKQVVGPTGPTKPKVELKPVGKPKKIKGSAAMFSGKPAKAAGKKIGKAMSRFARTRSR